jgi:hypothetical protein
MNAQVVARGPDGFTVAFTVSRSNEFPAYEAEIQQALNEAGAVATAEALRQFDTAGEAVEYGDTRYTSKGTYFKEYQTPFGVAGLERHLYQSPKGGATICPLEDRAGVILSATPALARTVASKYAEFGSPRVQHDLEVNHGRHLSRGFIEGLAEHVAMLAREEREKARYRLPRLETAGMTVLVALMSTPIDRKQKPSMEVGLASIGLYDHGGERQFRVLLADLFNPEPDRFPPDPDRFLGRVEREVERVRNALIAPHVFGITAGQDWAVGFFERPGSFERQVVDPFSLLDQLAEALARGPKKKFKDRREWLRELRYRLWHDPAWKDFLFKGLVRWSRDASTTEDDPDWRQIHEALARHEAEGRLDYRAPLSVRALGEAEVLAEMGRALLGDRFQMTRMQGTGRRAAEAVLVLRELTRNPDRWDQFWRDLTARYQGQGRPGKPWPGW